MNLSRRTVLWPAPPGWDHGLPRRLPQNRPPNPMRIGCFPPRSAASRSRETAIPGISASTCIRTIDYDAMKAIYRRFSNRFRKCTGIRSITSTDCHFPTKHHEVLRYDATAAAEFCSGVPRRGSRQVAGRIGDRCRRRLMGDASGYGEDHLISWPRLWPKDDRLSATSRSAVQSPGRKDPRFRPAAPRAADVVEFVSRHQFGMEAALRMREHRRVRQD